MAVTASTSVLAGLACCLALTVPFGVPAQDAPERVTSDTPEFCLHLLDQVSSIVRDATAPPSAEVTNLSAEGQKMCAHGQTKGGIMRLRRALVLLRSQDAGR
ncbi:MAG: hypothetical protein BGO51_11830 [Rhodospirillales bacterium 69-11]|nr:hypothetical protein [Rhodospirillales bacterium]MBN8928084.1 hypothetical protein [Rhodospirillales bacterium]OJW23217.1 MAG: hypothetical protein BGO51_11830 [Rhodospirillales bacterium 69-11]